MTVWSADRSGQAKASKLIWLVKQLRPITVKNIIKRYTIFHLRLSGDADPDTWFSAIVEKGSRYSKVAKYILSFKTKNNQINSTLTILKSYKSKLFKILDPQKCHQVHSHWHQFSSLVLPLLVHHTCMHFPECFPIRTELWMYKSWSSIYLVLLFQSGVTNFSFKPLPRALW